MDDYEARARAAVRRYKFEMAMTTAELASLLSIAPATMSAKLHGVRSFKLRELDALARSGVQIPAFGSSETSAA